MGKFDINSLMNNHSKSESEKPASFFKIEIINIHKIIPSKNNFYSVADIADLKSSIELIGLQHNLVVRSLKDESPSYKGLELYELISGERRYAALRQLADEGRTEFANVPCKIFRSIDDMEAELQLILANSTARRLSDYELCHQAKRLNELLTELKASGIELKGRRREAVAGLMNTSETQVARYDSINKNLITELKEAFKKEAIGVTVAYYLSQSTNEQQTEALEKHKSGISLNLENIKDIVFSPPKPSPAKEEIETKQESEETNNKKLTDKAVIPQQEYTKPIDSLNPTDVQSKEDKIKSCPFCGHSASLNKEYDKLSNSRWVTCDGCFVATKGYSGKWLAIESWNKRI